MVRLIFHPRDQGVGATSTSQGAPNQVIAGYVAATNSDTWDIDAQPTTIVEPVVFPQTGTVW